MAQWVGTQAAIVEDLGLIPCTPVPGNRTPSSSFFQRDQAHK